MLNLGSIVYLKEGDMPIMIVGQYPVFIENNQLVYSDYVGYPYPQGFNSNEACYFNMNNIEKIIFEGYAMENNQYYHLEKENIASLNIEKMDIH